MSKDPISAFLGTATVAKKESTKELKKIKSKEEKQSENYESNLQDDYDFARKNIRNLIEESMSILPELASLVVQMQLPEGYQAHGKFVKEIVDANDKLLQLTERQIKPKGKTTTNNTVVNATVPSNNENQPPENVVNNTLINITTEDLLNSILKESLNKSPVIEYNTIN